MTGMLVLRNTADNRSMLHAMVADASHVIALEADRLDESARLRTAGVLECNAFVAGIYVHVSWRMRVGRTRTYLWSTLLRCPGRS